MSTDSGREAAPGAQSVERALAVLNAFSEDAPERRVSELVAETGLGQSTVSRLVGALTSLGYLEQDERSGHYRVGPQVVRLANTALNESVVHRQARQVAQNLAHELRLGVNVAERQGQHLFYLCNFEGPLAPRSFTLVGRQAPLHATALGKSLLVDLTRSEIDDLLGVDYAAFTPHTITTLDALEAELDVVRSRGYAVELEEAAFSRACVAAPIRSRTGEVIAAISISGPLSAMNLPDRESELGRAVMESADLISTSLGHF